MESRGRRLFKPVNSGSSGEVYAHERDRERQPDTRIGEELRLARLSVGYELQDVADTLCIRRDHLEALEEGRYGDLPGPAYAVGFFRSYARFLGLDAGEVVEQFQAEMAGVVKRPRLHFPSPEGDEGRMPKTWLIALALVLAGLAYGGWQYFSAQERMATGLAPEVPDRLASLVVEPPISPPNETSRAEAETADRGGRRLATSPAEGPGEEVGLPSTEQTTNAAPTAAEEELETAKAESSAETLSTGGSAAVGESLWTLPSAPSATASDSQAEARAAAGAGSAGEEVALAGPALAGAANVYGHDNLDSRIIIKAKGDSWVQVQGPDNELLLTRILHEGDIYRVPNRANLVLTTGNAGALEIWVDDERAPELGTMGMVRRNIALDPERLLRKGGWQE